METSDGILFFANTDRASEKNKMVETKWRNEKMAESTMAAAEAAVAAAAAGLRAESDIPDHAFTPENVPILRAIKWLRVNAPLVRTPTSTGSRISFVCLFFFSRVSTVRSLSTFRSGPSMAPSPRFRFRWPNVIADVPYESCPKI